MSRESEFDRSVYDFIDKSASRHAAYGNDNLRRAIERIMAPVREIMDSLNKDLDWKNPPIPADVRKRIQNMIADHKNPPTIRDILEMAASKEPGTTMICHDLLEASRKLAQPFRYITPEESLRVIRDPYHVDLSIGWLLAVMARAFQAFSDWTAKAARSAELTHIICDKLATGTGKKGSTLLDRFKDKRGPWQSPMQSLVPQVGLSDITVEMNRATDTLFKEYVPKFREECHRVRDLGDTRATVQDLQSLVDGLTRLLDWGFFNSPRYLAPALLEEAVEAAMAINDPQHEKHYVPDELADLFYMGLWISNVLSVPNLGRDILEWYE